MFRFTCHPTRHRAAGRPPSVIADLFADLLAGDLPVESVLEAHGFATARELEAIGAPTPARTLAGVLDVPWTHPVGWCLCTHLLDGVPLLHLKEMLLLEWDGLSVHPIYHPSPSGSTSG
jgi:hypothetical protein